MITLINYSKSASNTFRLNDYIQFTLSVDAYSIDGFNTKIKTAVLQQKQDWKSLQIKDFKLIIEENYAFTPYNKFFIVLGAPNNYTALQKRFFSWCLKF